MADVQPENGYTKIADELLEVVPQYKFNGTQLRIMMVVWRYTYGFGRKDHEMSISFFVKATKLGKTQIDRELNNLIDANVLVVMKESSFTSPRKLGFNKNYDQWLIDKQSETVSKNADSQQIQEQSSKMSSGQSAKTLTQTVSKNADQDIHSFKDIITDITTTTHTETIGDVNQKIFGTLHINGMIQGFIAKYRDKGFTETFIKEVLWEAAETCSGGKPSIKYIESIAERWERDKIYSRYQNQEQKKAGEVNEQPRGRNQVVTPLRNSRTREALFPDDELDELNRASAVRLSQVQG